MSLIPNGSPRQNPPLKRFSPATTQLVPATHWIGRLLLLLLGVLCHGWPAMLLAEGSYEMPSLTATRYERAIDSAAKISLRVHPDKGQTVGAKFEWYKPGKTLLHPAQPSWWTAPNDNKDWTYTFSSELPIKGQTTAILLGQWSVKVFVDLGHGWQAVADRSFEIDTNEEPTRYRYRASLSQDVEPQYPYLPMGETNQFRTSEAETGGQVMVAMVFDYYHQDPGIGVQTKWYYWQELPDGTQQRRLIYTQPPSWSNAAVYQENYSPIWTATTPSLLLSNLVTKKYAGEWTVEVWVADLAASSEFRRDRNLYFTLIDDVPPTVTLSTPDHQTTNQPVVAVAGRVKDDIGAFTLTWSVNQGEETPVTSPTELTEWLIFMPVEEGENILTVTAADKAQNESQPQTLTVERDDQAEDSCFITYDPSTDPIDVYRGEQVLSQELLTVPGSLLPLSVSLTYHSQRLKDGPTGRGWEDPYAGTRLQELPNGDVKIYWTTHRYNRFTPLGHGEYQATHSACRWDQLVKQADGQFMVTRKDQTVYQFNPQGQLTTLTHSRGQMLQFSYSPTGLLQRVTEPVSGIYLDYVYNSDGLVETVSDPLGRPAQLSYDSHHLLVSATDAAGQTVTYTYDSHGQLLSGTNADGVQLFVNTYNDWRRITTQDDGRAENGKVQLATATSSATGQVTTTVTNRLGGKRTYTFNNQGRLLSFRNELGHQVTYTYDALGNRTSATDELGRRTTLAYDHHGNLSAITNALGQTTRLKYDDHHRRLAVTNALGKTIRFTYEAKGNLLSMTDPLNQVTRYTYNDAGQVLTQTSPRGGVTTYEYDHGFPVRVTDPAGVVSTLGYDAAGRLTQVTDAEHHITTLTYDGANRVTTLTNPLGHTRSFTYNSRGQLLTITDDNGNVTRRQYDGNGNLISQVNALNQETRYEYDGENHLTKITDAKGHATSLSYDAKGRLVSLTNPLGHTQRLEYDAADNLRKLFDAFGQVVKVFNYDAVDNVTQLTETLNSTKTFDYDALSRLVKITDPLTRVTQWSYDDLNRLVDSLDALAGHSHQGFDEEGNRTALIDPNGNETHFEFDQSGRLVAETVATGEKVSYTYNARDLLAQVTNARGQSRQLEYDAAGRLLSFTDLDGTVNFSYDKNGNVLTVTDSQGTISRTYDALNRVTSYTDVKGNTLHYEYDEVGNLVGLTYPDGKVVHYEYDAADQLTKVTDWAGRVTGYEYDKNGRLISETRPNGTQMSRRYNVAGQLVQQVEKDNRGELISQFDFSYDATGNILNEQKLPKPESVSLPPVTMTYSAANRLATYNGQAVQFDADGNLVSGPLSGEMANFRFDSRNRLVAAGETSYRYDAENQRIGVNQTSYVVNSQPALSQVLVKEENGVKTFYVYGLGLLGEEKEGEHRSYHFDFRGSTVALTDKTGKVVQRFQYGPYGELVKGDTAVTPFLFNGKYGVMTDGNGLYYMRARFYSAVIKRFVNMDVLLGKVGEGQTLNRYAFVTGNPSTHIDPTGLASWRSQTEEGCQRLKRKIENLRNELKRQRLNISNNPQGLPTFPPYPDAKLSQSVQGHVQLYFQYKRDLEQALEDYNKRCGGPGGTPTPNPVSISIPSPNSSNDMYFWVGAGTTVIGVGLGVFFFPEVTIPGLIVGGACWETAQ